MTVMKIPPYCSPEGIHGCNIFCESDLLETVQMMCNSFFMNLLLRLQSQIRAGLTENNDSRKEKLPAEEF